MLSIPDMALLGAAALIFFGPDQLPKVARKVGLFMRDAQNMSQTFIREMERAADDHDAGGNVARAHLIDEPSPVYGAYDGGYVSSPQAHDIPVAEYPLEVPAPDVPAHGAYGETTSDGRGETPDGGPKGEAATGAPAEPGLDAHVATMPAAHADVPATAARVERPAGEHGEAIREHGDAPAAGPDEPLRG
jgi:Sec-independent protein translocase protein TatA